MQMHGEKHSSGENAGFESVPLFPLPNVVLFPNALLPLHIFEERYKAMIVDALAGERRIAMALLSAGWEACSHGRPLIEPVVCVGTIISHKRLNDGRFNFLLRGETRARINCERPKPGDSSEAKPYRIARLQRMRESEVMEIDLSDERRRMEALLTDGWPAKMPLADQIRSLLRGAMKTADIADLVAFHLLDDVKFKQSILADADIRGRVNRLLSSLNCLDVPTAEPILDAASDTIDPSLN